jgi:DNA-binding NarL/FixJ family response regulator
MAEPPRRVLIVEDRWMVADAFGRALARTSHFELLPAASNVVAALETCARSCPDIVLLDADMPGLDDAWTIDQILRACPGTDIVMMSALPREATRRRLIRLGARDLVSTREAAADLLGILKGTASHGGGETPRHPESGTDWG